MKREIKPRQIEAFKAAMQQGSASAAAEVMFITQPAVSRLLSDLEDSVGFALFERQGRGLVPTIDGKRLYQSVERVYLGLESIEEAAHSIKEGELGKVRVGALPVYAGGVLAEQAGVFIANNPGIKIELDSADQADLLTGLKAGRFDLAVSSLPVDDSWFSEIYLGMREAVCILPPEHPLSQNKRIKLEQLHQYAFVGLSGANPFRKVINQMVKEAGGSLNEVAAARTQRAAGLMVGAGAGISIVDPEVCQYLDAERVSTRPLVPSVQWEFGILYPAKLTLTIAASKLIDHLTATIR